MDNNTIISSSSTTSLSTQFPSYSSPNLTDIAARVITELNFPHHDPFHDDFYSPQNDVVVQDIDFEFTILTGSHTSSPVSADEIFSNGRIKPIFRQNDTVSPQSNLRKIRLPLRKLLLQERLNSSETDQLDGIPPDSYCVWNPKKKKNDDVLLKQKSKSTGSNSKRWRIKDLLYRSNSDGKETFVFLAGDLKRREKTPATVTEKSKFSRQDFVAFFNNAIANGISRTVRPF